MKEGWKYVSLGECCDVLNGLWKGKKEPFVHVGVIRNANFTKEFTLDFSNVEYLDVEERQYSKRKLRKGDLIVEKSGGSEKWPVGRAVLFLKDRGEFSFSNFTSVLRIKDSVNITPKYLYLYLFFVYMRGDTRYMQKATTGIHNIEFEKYLSIQIPLPPLPEQQRIVDYLDSTFAEIDALKAKAAEEVANAKAMFDAALREEMTPKEGWEEKTLGEICSIFGRIGFRGYTKKDLVPSENEGAITISPSNIKDGYMDFSNCTYISWYKYEESPEIKIFNGDILIVKTGSSYGKSAIVENLHHQATINPQSVVLKNILINNYYLAYYVRSDNVIKSIESFVSGSAIPTFSQANLAKVVIAFPSLDKQETIVSRLDSLRSLLTELERKYAKIAAECDALKQAILKETFE